MPCRSFSHIGLDSTFLFSFSLKLEGLLSYPLSNSADKSGMETKFDQNDKQFSLTALKVVEGIFVRYMFLAFPVTSCIYIRYKVFISTKVAYSNVASEINTNAVDQETLFMLIFLPGAKITRWAIISLIRNINLL